MMRVGPVIAMLMLALPAFAAEASDDMPFVQAPSEMTGPEIDAHNQGLALGDPAYIKCRRIEETGSLVKKPRVCKTTAQWKQTTDKGNQDARDTFETLARGWSNSQEPSDQVGPQVGGPRQ